MLNLENTDKIYHKLTLQYIFLLKKILNVFIKYADILFRGYEIQECHSCNKIRTYSQQN